MERIKAQVHLVPTPRVDGKMSSLMIAKENGKLSTFNSPNYSYENATFFHLHITTDEKVNQWDNFYDTIKNRVGRWTMDYDMPTSYTEECRKLVATTDRSKYKYDESVDYPSAVWVRVPESFTKEYCEAGGIDEVYLELEWDQSCVDTPIGHIHSIKVNQSNEVIIHPFQKSIREIVESHVKEEYWCKDETEHSCFEDGFNTTVDVDAIVKELEELINNK